MLAKDTTKLHVLYIWQQDYELCTPQDANDLAKIYYNTNKPPVMAQVKRRTKEEDFNKRRKNASMVQNEYAVMAYFTV